MNRRLKEDFNYVDVEGDDNSSYSNARFHAQDRREHYNSIGRKQRQHLNTFKKLKEYVPSLNKEAGRIDDDDTSDDNSLCSNTNTRNHRAEDKREHHNSLERKRRHQIKESFMGLTEVVPSLKELPGRASRAQVLKHAAEYIIELQQGLVSVKEEIDCLNEEKLEVEEKIKKVLDSEANPHEKKLSLNFSSSVSKKRALNDPSSVSSQRIVNHSSGLCSTESVNHSSVPNSAWDDNNPWCFIDATNSTISSDLSLTGTASRSNSTTIDNDFSSSESECDIRPTYSNGANNNDSDTYSFRSVGIVNDSGLFSKSLLDLEEDLHDFGSTGYEVSLPLLDDANDSSYLNSPRMFDAVSSNKFESSNGKVDSTAFLSRLNGVDSEENESSVLKVEECETLNRFVYGDSEDDEISSGFDLKKFKVECMPAGYEDSIDFNLDSEFLELVNADDVYLPSSKRFRKC